MADYINREVTLKILTRIADCVSDSRRRAVTRCIREIALLPPANVEPVRLCFQKGVALETKLLPQLRRKNERRCRK